MKKKGFTLIELLAAIVILGILATVATIAISRYTKYAKDKKFEHIVKTLKLSAEVKYNTEIEKGLYTINELVDSENDLKSPYGGMLTGYIVRKCENNNCNFVECIKSGNNKGTTISVNNGGFTCSSKGGNTNDFDYETEVKRQENFEKIYGYRIMNIYEPNEDDIIDNLDEEDLYYKSKSYAIKDNETIKIEKDKSVYNYVTYKTYYTNPNNGRKYEKQINGFVLANDGKTVTLLITNDSENKKVISNVNTKLPFYNISTDTRNITKLLERTENYILVGDKIRLLDINDIKAMAYPMNSEETEFKGNSYLQWIETDDKYWVASATGGTPYNVTSKDSENYNKCTYIQRNKEYNKDSFSIKEGSCGTNLKIGFVIETTPDNIVGSYDEVEIVDSGE